MSVESSIIIAVITFCVTIINVVIAVSNYFNGRKEKSVDKTKDFSYKQGQTDQMLKNIMEKLEKMDAKIDKWESVFDDKIEKAIEQHIKMFHKGSK